MPPVTHRNVCLTFALCFLRPLDTSRRSLYRSRWRDTNQGGSRARGGCGGTAQARTRSGEGDLAACSMCYEAGVFRTPAFDRNEGLGGVNGWRAKGF